MIKLNVPDMSCNHCARSITSAIQGKYSAATVVCDLENKTVSVEQGPGALELQETLKEAGYSSTLG
ncbi:MAG: heavy-metal-associated domain-containing protein [Betaproteobacteria bacterium]